MPTLDFEGFEAVKHKVLVLGNVRSEGLDIVRAFADLTVLPEPVKAPDVAACIGEMDAILHKVAKLDRETIGRQKKLRIIARHGVGLDDLDLVAISEMGIPVSVTGNANTNAVAEATVGLLFSALRHITQAESMIKRDRRWVREELTGRELRGLTVGIIGFGRIGRLVASYLLPFGCRIIVHDVDPNTVRDCTYSIVGLEDLLRLSDVISIHCPLTPETYHLIDNDALRVVKRDCIIVNTSRGALIDKEALVTAAKEERIASAVLDVFDREPPDFDDDVFRCARILTTPHIAAMTSNAQMAMAIGAANEIRRVLVDGIAPSNNVLSISSQYGGSPS